MTSNQRHGRVVKPPKNLCYRHSSFVRLCKYCTPTEAHVAAMKPKQTRKEPSERTRNLRHGAATEKQAAVDADADGKTRVNAQVAALALRSAAGSGIAKAKSKKLTSKQRKRREQMIEKGSAFTDKLVKKAVETDMSQKNVKQRALDWEQVNDKAMAELFEVDEREARVSRIET